MQKKIFILLTILPLLTLLLPQKNTHAYLSRSYFDLLDNHIQTGTASWYSTQDPGINKYTANMEIFDDTKLTAAMWRVPFDQKVRVTNLENGKSVIVRVNDRGPHKRLVQNGRIIDLSKKAFSGIAPLQQGLINIQLELL